MNPKAPKGTGFLCITNQLLMSETQDRRVTRFCHPGLLFLCLEKLLSSIIGDYLEYKIKKLLERSRDAFAKAFLEKDTGFIELGHAIAVLKESKKIRVYSKNGQMSCDAYILPEWRKMNGSIRIFPEKEPNPHIVLLGMSGFGKSTMMKSMLIDISRMGKAAILFDAHNEHKSAVLALGGRVYDASRFGINILELDGVRVNERISEIVNLFKSVYGLGQIQAIKLSQCLSYCYRKNSMLGQKTHAPTIADLISEINIFINNSRTASEKNSLMHLKDRIYNISASVDATVEVSALKDGISSFSLASLKNKEARIIYIHELLKRLYNSMKENAKEKGTSIFIMIDEAQFLLGSDNGSKIVTSMVEEGRKYGVGLIIATHISANLDRQIMANASTLISFYARDPTEINYISNAMSSSNQPMAASVKARLRSLGQNQAIMISGRMRDPVVINCKRISALSDALNEKGKDLEEMQVIAIKEPLKYDEAGKRLGKEALDKMIISGRIGMEPVEIGGERTEWIMKKGQKSIEHEVSVGIISKKFAEFGIKHYIMNNSKGPDIVAYVNGTKTAIEYETGRKSYKETASMMLKREGQFKTSIIFTNDKAYPFYSQYFQKENVKVLQISKIEEWLHSNGERLKEIKGPVQKDDARS